MLEMNIPGVVRLLSALRTTEGYFNRAYSLPDFEQVLQ